MKAIGIVRRIDDLGRITLPRELRRTMGIEVKDPVEIYTDDDVIVLKKYEPKVKECVLCHSSSHLIEVNGSTICLVCAHRVIKTVQEVSE